MKLLLDTCTFLWLITDAEELSDRCREAFRSPGNQAYLSTASAWEIAVKHGLGRLPLASPPEQLVPEARRLHGIESLALEEEASLHVHRLPSLHRDPFDRMLVSQAIVHGLVILTPDPLIRQYPARTLW